MWARKLTTAPTTNGEPESVWLPHREPPVTLTRWFSHVVYDLIIIYLLYHISNSYFHLLPSPYQYLPSPFQYLAWPLYRAMQVCVCTVIWCFAQLCGWYVFGDSILLLRLMDPLMERQMERQMKRQMERQMKRQMGFSLLLKPIIEETREIQKDSKSMRFKQYKRMPFKKY